MSKERVLQALNEKIIDRQEILRLQESDDWRVVYDSLMQEIQLNLREMLDPQTTSQRYYELRAEINAVKKLMSTLDGKLVKGESASKKKQQIEEV